jgi:hypothetical protein
MKRTLKQNDCLHEYCETLADRLNAAGYDFNDGKVIRLPVAFTKENVKEYIFRRVMSALYPDIESTADLDTKQIQDVYENVNRITAETFGISVSWPSVDSKHYEK